MQRSIAYQTALLGLAYFTAFTIYISLSSIYLFLPPLFAVLFFHFRRALDRNRIGYLFLIVMMLLVYEADKGYLLLSSLIYFVFLYNFVVPRIAQYTVCKWCQNLAVVILAYIGFWALTFLLHQVLWLPMPAIDWHIVYYIAIEFLLIGLL